MEKLLLPSLHLAALIGFLTYKMKTPFAEFMSSRHQTTVEGLSRSKAQAKEAQRRKVELDQKFSNLEKERQKIRQEWREQEVQQAATLQENSKKIIEQMRIEAKKNQEALDAFFREETMNALGRSVLKLVREKIQKQLSGESSRDIHNFVNSKFIQELLTASSRTSPGTSDNASTRGVRS